MENATATHIKHIPVESKDNKGSICFEAIVKMGENNNIVRVISPTFSRTGNMEDIIVYPVSIIAYGIKIHSTESRNGLPPFCTLTK